jgi:hypothetical protein
VATRHARIDEEVVSIGDRDVEPRSDGRSSHAIAEQFPVEIV